MTEAALLSGLCALLRLLFLREAERRYLLFNLILKPVIAVEQHFSGLVDLNISRPVTAEVLRIVQTVCTA